MILIIGGLGYIGSVLREELDKINTKYLVLDNDIYRLRQDDKYIHEDIRHYKRIEKHIKKADIIVNLAAIVGDPACCVNRRLTNNINVTGTFNVVDICRAHKKRLIHISTCSVYGDKYDPCSEDTPPEPKDYYAQTKRKQERLISKFLPKSDYCILRLGTVFGLSPRMRFDLVVNKFIGTMVDNEVVTVHGHGQQKRSFVHVRDVGRAIIFTINNNLNGFYNVAMLNYSIIDLALKIKSILDKGTIKIVSHVGVDQRNYFINGDRLHKKGFLWKYGLREAIKEISVVRKSLMNLNHPIYHNLELALKYF